MDETGVDWDARIEALATAFAQSLPQKREEAMRSWQAWQDGDAGARVALTAVVHRLGGSADNYGCVALGEAARALDALLIPRLGASAADVEAAVASFLAAFDEPPEPI